MRRRNFIAGLASTTATWPFVARAQEPERVRRIGVLVPPADDLETRTRLTTFRQALQGLGWTDGRNVHIETRFAAGDAADTRKYAVELAALAPDVILTMGSAGLPAVLQTTRTVPIVFVLVPDPVGSGFVHSLSQPGGNATGFMMFEYNLCGKWLELLKEIAPRVTRAAVLRDPAVSAGIGQFAVIQSVAPSVGVDVIPVNLGDAAEIEREVAAFAQSANGGLILTPSALSQVHRDQIITLAARHKLPAVYQERNYVAAGGLISYGPNFVDQFRRAADYVDRILKGEKPADMPVQAPTKYELVINLKTAKALGLAVPPSVRARADEVTNNDVLFCTAECLLLAQSRHRDGAGECPLLGVKRTSRFLGRMSAFDPKRTLAT
jgi:putative tryptophan/tyrosine transport system substrate-binding protein